MGAAAEAACPEEESVARLYSFHNTVQVRLASTSALESAFSDMPVCLGDTVEVGDRSRAHLVFLVSNESLTIEQNTEFVIERAGAGGTLIRIIRGAALFFARGLGLFEVETAPVNLNVEGTEFLVEVQPDRTRITVFEGVVRASNAQGEAQIGPNQFTEVQQGQAPVVQEFQIDVRPRDAVRWAVYYEPIMPLAPLADLDQVAEADRDDAFYIQRAAALLQAGRVDEAQEDIDRVLASERVAADAYALRATIDIARNDATSALSNANQAVEQDSTSVSALIARSYAWQANLDLERARDDLEAAVAVDPTSGRAWARLAEIRMSLGLLDEALEAAGMAESVSPDIARIQTVVGFARLAQVRTTEAREAFQAAIARESDAPLAWLGLGLARIREGDLEAGREEIEKAVGLNPDSSLLRSYLGKAYYDERRELLSERELLIAQQLDTRDPTPLYYGAILKQGLNRPVEGLADLRRSIALNDNRAVYRSRLLLDADLGARGARLGRIYHDLGFEQVALLQGWQSVTVDPTDHAAHRLLADSYLVRPRSEIARDSELLQAQLLQPLNLNPVQPRLGQDGLSLVDQGTIAGIGFNEFAPLFVGDAVRVVADAFGGQHATLGDNLTVAGVSGRLSYSVGHFGVRTDGIRENNDRVQNVSNAFLQGQITPSTSAQLEVRHDDTDAGDLRLLFYEDNYLPRLRNPFDTTSVRLGGRHTFGPGSVLIGSYVHRDLSSDLDTGQGFRVSTDEDADFAEVRHLQRWRAVDFTAGVGRYHGDRVENRSFGPRQFPPSATRILHTNAFAYATVRVSDRLDVVAGVSQDDFSGTVVRDQTNPKFGVTWVSPRGTTIRGAVFRSMKRTLVSSQTLEPTHVAGFNQFFDETNGTDSWRYGVGIDQQVSEFLFTGFEASVRDLTVPFRVAATGGQGERTEDERIARAYASLVLTRQVTLTTAYRLDWLERDPAGNNADLLADATTHRLAVDARVFWRSGGFGSVRGTFVDQDGHFQNRTQMVLSGSDRFWTVDAAAGYRLPGRRGIIAVEARNLFNEDFAFQDSTPEDSRLLPRRTVTARLTLMF